MPRSARPNPPRQDPAVTILDPPNSPMNHAVRADHVDTFPPGQDLAVADESGACSETLAITIRPGAGTSDIIGGVDNSAVVLSNSYQAQSFRRGAANVWVRY